MSPRELASALYGLALLFKFDGRAWEFFDRSPSGFWSSYVVAVIVAPFHFAHVFLTYGKTPPTLGPVAYTIVEVLAYVLTWTLFPFAMMYVSRFLERDSRYFWHMVPYNWFQLPIAVPLFSLALLNHLGLIPAQAYSVFNLFAMVVVAVYTTFIGAVGLRIPIGTAMSLMVLDYTLTFLAGALIARI
jgi:hypothetical protein